MDDEIHFHLTVISKCCRKTRRGIAILATFKRSRHPFFYPRDGACVIKALTYLSSTNFAERAYEIIEGIAKFTQSIQSKSGFWGQRYTIGGRDRSIYKQEDNNAHGIAIIANYLLMSKKLKKRIKGQSKFISSIVKGMDFAIQNHFKQEKGLFYSTTSVHESTIEKGYTLWVNLSYWNALNLISKYKHKRLTKYDEFRKSLEKKIREAFIYKERFVARLNEEGMPDLRTDVTLMSPFYFDFQSDNITKNTMDFIAKELVDTEIGLIQRYVPAADGLSRHMHAGAGPWVQYSAILAQYYFSTGNKTEGNKIVEKIKSYESKKGYLPEHLSTKERFLEFIKKEWKTGIDYKKEFDPEILLPNLDFDRIVEEVFYMKNTYDKIKKRLSGNPSNIIRYAIPLAWAHAEYLAALMIRNSKG